MFGFGKNAQPPPFVSAVIAAAGSAARMEGIDKQQAHLEEIPVVVRAVEAFCRCPRIDEIVLVCREEAIPDYFALARQYGLDKVVSVVGGGETRQDSVFRGVAACSPDAGFFAIHDGARPLVDEAVIEDCLDAALLHGAAATGVPVKDTIKICDGAGFITSTPNRAGLMSIQTPQIFAASLYRAAMAKALAEGRAYTDDCQLVERLGSRVYVSPGSYGNIKITTPEDLALAGAILRYRGEGPEDWE